MLMRPTLFRCPITEKLVQHFVGELPSDGEPDARFEAVACPACGHTHMVNVTTGKVLGQKDRLPQDAII